MPAILKKPSCYPILFLVLILIAGCEGPEGPEGPPGPEVIPVSFEFEAELLEDEGFEYCVDIPGQLEVFTSDVMLAYVLEDYIEEDDLDVWRQLPVTDFTDRGTRILGFDYTALDICLFLDADYPLEADDELDQVLVRAVHVPAALLSQSTSEKLKNAGSPQKLELLLEAEIQKINQ